MTETTPNAPTAREAGEQNVAIACEKGCRYLGFADAVNHCPYCELGKAGDALAEALTRAQAAEAALLAARREVERMQFALRAIVEWKDFPPTVDGLAFMRGFAGAFLAAAPEEPIAPTRDWCVAAAHREAESDIERLQWQITCLRTALENWGRHFDWCASRKDSSSACDCGLAAALAATQEGK